MADNTPTIAAMRLVADVEAEYLAGCERVYAKTPDYRLAEIIERTKHKVAQLRHTVAEREGSKL